jgi:hypothetical protein
MIESLGETEGHPLRTPYAIRWMYQPEEAEFNKKYRALAMPRLAYTDEIRALIEESPAPDISNLIGRGDIATLRASMEEHALIKLPFDRIFAAAEAEGGGQRSAAAPKAPPSAPRAPEVHTEPAKAEPARARRGSAAKAEPKKPDYPPGTVIIPCDRCGAEMADYDDTSWMMPTWHRRRRRLRRHPRSKRRRRLGQAKVRTTSGSDDKAQARRRAGRCRPA